MRGLVYKDLVLFGSAWKSYAFVLGVFLLLTVSGVYDSGFLFMMISILLCMYPASSFSYDELAKWDRFVAAAPGGRKKAVQGKYLFALLIAGIALAAEVLLTLILLLLKKTTPMGALPSCVAGVAGAGFINAILLPLLFRFGAQKARIMLIAAAALGAGGIGALLAVAGLAFHGSGNLLPYQLLLPILTLLALFISYRISLRIYKKKEF